MQIPENVKTVSINWGFKPLPGDNRFVINHPDSEPFVFPELPKPLEMLECFFVNSESLPILPSSLKHVYCNNTGIKRLTPENETVLPNKLITLDFMYSELTALPSISHLFDLYSLNVTNNHLTSLPPLPDNLVRLVCSYNPIIELPALPNSLCSIICSSCQLNELPELPNSLENLWTSKNCIGRLPKLPDNLLQLACDCNNLTELPKLPPKLVDLICSNNDLAKIPVLPLTLKTLICDNNCVSELPTLPETLNYLNCSNNNLTKLPLLPKSLWEKLNDYPDMGLNCSGNPWLYVPVSDSPGCVPVELAKLFGVPITPNYNRTSRIIQRWWRKKREYSES